VKEATDAQLKSQEKAVFELEKKEANADRAKAMKKREKELGEEVVTESEQSRLQQIQRKQLMLDRQKLQIRKRGILKKQETQTEKESNVIANEGVMTMLGRKKKEKKAEKAMDAGARAKRMLARKIHAKYVSGSEDNVPDDIRESDDKAFKHVVSMLKKKYGDDAVLTKGQKPKPPTAAQKKKNAEIRAKRAKEDHRDPTEKASDGRYSDRYSNRGSD